MLEELEKSDTEFEVLFTNSKISGDQTSRVDGKIVYNPEIGFTVLAHEGYHAWRGDQAKIANKNGTKPNVQLVPGLQQPDDKPIIQSEHAATRFQNIVAGQFLIQNGANGKPHPTLKEIMEIKGPTEHGLRTYDQMVRVSGQSFPRMQSLPIRRSYNGDLREEMSFPFGDPANFRPYLQQYPGWKPR